MQKKSISVLSAVLCIVLAFASCGIKADPKPLAVVRAGVIGDLRGEVKDGVLFLSFTVPAAIEAKKKGDEVEIAGFKILKGCGTCLGALAPFRTVTLGDAKGYTIAAGRLYIYDDDLTPGSDYAYRVQPFTKKGTAGDDSNAFIIKWTYPPGAPAGPLKAVESDARVELTWTKEEGYLYNIYRSEDETYPLFPLNGRPTENTLYMDAGLTNGRTYVYEVRAVRMEKGIAFEGPGVKVKATPSDRTPPVAPAQVKAVKKGGTIEITWTENTEKDLAGYNVYRVMGTSSVKLNKTPVKEGRFSDGKAPDYRFIAYYVTAVDGAGNESDPSQESIVYLQE